MRGARLPVRWRPTPAGLARELPALQRAPLTWDAVGATDDPVPPAGHRVLHHEVRIGHGRAAFDRAATALLAWRLHRAAGMILAVSTPVADDGAVVVVAAPFGPLGVVAPCRVLRRLDGPTRRGFAYATLPGHPLHGEERFTVELTGDDEVRFVLRSVSRPAGVLAVAPALVGAGQQLVNRRYLAAAPGLVDG